MFITFEGLDFCGKSTQVELLSSYLKSRNKNVEIIREPGGTNISEKIRDVLLDRTNAEMFIETELLLFSASRAQLVREIIIPLLKKNCYVISDRFHDSSIAYQGYGRGINLKSVIKIQNFAIADAVPKVTFFLDIPIEEMLKRKQQVSEEQLDRIELSVNKFYETVREGYLKMCGENDRFRKIDGLLPKEQIHDLIVKELQSIDKNL